MMLCDAQKGIAELERITKEDGIIYLSFDILDEEDERLPHEILPDGSYQYTQYARKQIRYDFISSYGRKCARICKRA